KWETGTTLPELEILLKLSQLYGITINELLEPVIPPRKISDFEQISAVPRKELQEILKQVDTNSLVTALMGASPEINSLCENLFPNIDFERARAAIGRVRVETVEALQKQILSMINLSG
ncbi:MAG: hypothetical protein K2P39_14985, partial [Lachnospiraceae bacterium]|nr:hypothetical protein [Lachnospiraceae bacterium]